MRRIAGLLLPVLLWTLVLSNGRGAEPSRITLPGHVPKVLSRLAPIGAVPATTNLTLAIGLSVRNQAALAEFLRQLQDPRSPNFHQYLTPEQFTERFGPTTQEYQALIQFAESNGFRVVGKHANRLVLEVEASARNIERAFQITLRTYKHPTEGREFYAPDTEPSVPANLPACIVEGLSDFWRPHPLVRPAKALLAQPLGGSGPSGYYAGQDFRNAYVPGTTLTGAGQAVGLLEFSAYYQVDITNYENTIGLTNYVPLVNVVVGHGPSPSTANNVEVALDIEVAIAMAPGLSKVIVYEQGSINPSTILSRMANDNLAKQLSSSWAWSGGPSATIDSIFQQMAAQGQSFFQASGDSDAYTGANLLDNANASVAPVDSTNVTSVGGTTLSMSGSGVAWASETVWNFHNYGGSYANTGSGGGISSYYTIPTWQANVSMAANSGSTVWRNIPDVALTADQIYVAYNNGSSGGMAGTSCAAPLWAGLCALVNQASITSGHSTVGFLNPALYAIAQSTNYAACFHDVTTGNNIGTNTPGLFNATAGYDLCTGLGTPNGPGLINALVPYPQILAPPVSQTVTNGGTVRFSVTAGGQPPFSYQWLLNGANLPAGANITGTTSNVLSLASVTTANAGNYNVIVTNSSGSVTSSVATLTVVMPPTFVTQPTNQTVAAGVTVAFSATVSGTLPLARQWQKDGVSLVNGGNVAGATSNVLTLTAVTSTNAGNYTLLVTNAYGSATSSSAALTVMQPPTVTVPPAAQTVQCGSNAAFSITATGTMPLRYQWSLDGVAVPGATNTSLSLTNVHLPAHTIVVVVTNLYGSATNSATLTVQDTLPPVITLVGGSPLYVELGSSFVEPGATAYDSCAGAVPVSASGTVNTGTVGTNTLAYSANDGNGNSATALRRVVVRDTTPPTLEWSFTNLVLAADAGCSASLPDLTGTNFIRASDLSGACSITQNPTNGAVLALGTNQVVLTVVDASGNAAYSTNTVVVQDQTPPVITLVGGSPLYVELGNSFVEPGATAYDSCAGAVPVTGSGTVNPNVPGTNSLTYSANDGNGNSATVTRLVIVRDTTPPAIAWSFTNLVLAANAANCSALMPDVTGTNFIVASDLSGVVSISQNPTNGAVLPLGTHEVVLTVQDVSGNAAWSTNTVVVQDQTPPVITLVGDSLVYLELGSSFVNPGATAYDTCAGAVPVTVSGAVNSEMVGTNTLTYSADDGNGNSSTAVRLVVVRDTVPPTIAWSFTNLVLAADAGCSALLPDLTGTNFIVASDLSGTISITQSPTNGAVLPLGTNQVVLTVLDASGNAAWSTNTVIIQDQTPPVITLIGGSPLYLEQGSSFVEPGATAYDTCAGAVPVTVSGVVNTEMVGTNTLTYSADDGNGNSSTAVRLVIVREIVPPTIKWSFTNLVLAADAASCSALMPDVTGTNFILASDSSGAITISQSPTNGAVLLLGTNQVVLTVLDASGNAAYSTNSVVVQDQTPPAITLIGGSPLYVELGSSFVEPGATAYDACAGAVLVTASGTVNTGTVGTNTLTYLANDGNGNSATAERLVVVRDTTPPTIAWTFTNLVVAAEAGCSASLPDLTGTNFIRASDLSGALSITQSPTNGAVLALGTNEVVLTVLDASGNVAYSTNTVVVQDQTPPVITLIGGSPLYVELGGSFVEPGATAYDSCAGAVPVSASGTVNTGTVGTNTLAYSANDANGNSATVARLVIVRDTTPPAIAWSFTNLVLAANAANCSALMPDVTGTNFIVASDLSGVVSISQNPTNGAVLPLGTHEVVLTVLDASGNAAYSTNTVVVQDQTPPLIAIQPLSQALSAGTNVSFSVAASACTPLAFQWFFNHTALAGQTSGTLTLSNIDATLAGDYFVVVSSSAGSSTSAVAVLSVNLLASSVTLLSSENAAGFKDSLAFTATVFPTNATGSIQFWTNNKAFDAESLVGGMAASVTNINLPRGTNLITAVYSGDSVHLPATNTLAQIVTNHLPVAAAFVTNRAAGSTVLIPISVLASTWSDADDDVVSLAGIGISTNGVTVTNNAGTLVYYSSNNVDDTFICDISDGWGGTNHQTVTILMQPAPTNAVPAITSVASGPNQTLLLGLTGSAGSAYVLETCPNLDWTGSWLPIATNTLGADGSWHFSDSVTNSPRQFYRLRLAQ